MGGIYGFKKDEKTEILSCKSGLMALHPPFHPSKKMRRHQLLPKSPHEKHFPAHSQILCPIENHICQKNPKVLLL